MVISCRGLFSAIARHVAVALVAAGCAGATEPARSPGPTVRARWDTAVRPAPTAKVAAVFFPGDAKRIDELKPSYLGRAIVRASADVKEAEIEQIAAEWAARHGGTHVVLTSEEDVEKSVGTVETGGAKTCSAVSWTATCATSAIVRTDVTRTTKFRVFSIFAVDPAEWDNLPPQLRPTK